MARVRAVMVLGALAGLTLAGCGSGLNMSLVTSTGPATPTTSITAPAADASSSPAPMPSASATTPAPVTTSAPAEIDATSITVAGREPKPGKDVRPGVEIRVGPVVSGTTVALTRSTLDGTIDDTSIDHVISGKWTSAPLAPEKDYQVVVTAPDGSTKSANVRTQDAPSRSNVYISPSGGTFGVGMPITIEFSGTVKDKAEIEKHLTITATKDIGQGAWFWPDSDTVIFRPRYYWPANTKIQVDADLRDVEVMNGVWGTQESTHFQTGDEVILKESLTRHDLVYFKNGKKIATFPISGGMPGWETLNGTKIVHEAYTLKRMINRAPGANYDVEVPYAMRLTYSGEFMHAAPWNGNIGYANTSHGCTNMRYDDAVWMYDHTRFGDVFITHGGAAGSMTFGDGLGGVWALTWPRVIELSALGTDGNIVINPQLGEKPPPTDYVSSGQFYSKS